MVRAGLAEQLSSIYLKRLEKKRAIALHDPFAMLPLHYARWATGFDRIGYGAVVSFFVEAIAGKGVGYACSAGLNEFIVDWIVETLDMCQFLSFA